MFQCYAVEKLHGDEASAVLLADFVNGADVGVIQRGGGSRLAPKTFQGLRVLCQGLRQELQGHEPAQLHILRFINHAHATSAELLDDAVMRNGLSDQRRRVRHRARILVFCCRPSQREPSRQCSKEKARETAVSRALEGVMEGNVAIPARRSPRNKSPVSKLSRELSPNLG